MELKLEIEPHPISCYSVLIVLYGIETKPEHFEQRRRIKGLNRTLWN